MALRKILTDGDTALHKMCRPVTSFDARLHTLLDDLKETLADANGAGLAAPQVGILRRVVIVVDGNFFEAEGEEIVARCFCHEIEHLDGHLFTEHTDRLYTTEELDRMMEEQGE